MYYDRSAGLMKDEVRTVDSFWIGQAVKQYKNVVDAFETAKGTFETDNKAWDAAITAREADPTKALAKRPVVPSVPGAYTGPALKLSEQQRATMSAAATTVTK